MSSLPSTAASAGTEPSTAAGQVASAAQTWSVTLLTGDRIVVRRDHTGAYRAQVPGGRSFSVVQTADHLYVVPDDVRALLHSVLDIELFDVRALIAEGLDDAGSVDVPVVVRQAGPENGTRLEAATAGALDARRVLPATGFVAARLPKARAGHLGALLRQRADRPRTASATGHGLDGVSRIWLDRSLSVAWDRNLEQIGAPTAWTAGHTGAGVKVAVLDTGIDVAHPDVAGRVTVQADFTGKGSVADGHGHGTHVAGIAVGTGRGNQGLRRGVAPDAALLVGKVMRDDGKGPTSAILAGMEWAVAQGADVVNMSLGGGPSDGSDPLSQAVNSLTRRGTLFVVSAGNSGPGEQTVGSPGAADAALTVAAVDGADTVASFSSRGPRVGGGLKPDLAAPGVRTVAARAAGTAMGAPVDALYTAASGTSMAAPHVAGAAALLVQRHPDWTPAQLKAVLSGTADVHQGSTALEQGAGRLDLTEALATTVLPEDEDVDLGYLTFPQAGVVTAEAAWRNDGAEPITLELGLQVRDPAGAVVPVDRAWLSASSVTVPAGGRAAATVHVDPRQTTAGQHAGYLTATVRGTGQVLTTPVGFHDEREMYPLTVRGVDRAGKPLGAAGSATIFNVDDLAALFRPFQNYDATGSIRLRVPKGRYHVDAEQVSDYKIQSGTSGAVVDVERDAVDRIIEPEVTVDRPTELVLDPRRTAPMSTAMQGVRTATTTRGSDVWRTDARGSTVHSWGSDSGSEPVQYSKEIRPVTSGEFRTEVVEHLIQPGVDVVTGGRQLRLGTVSGASLPAASGRYRLVDAGAGTAEELTATRVAGRIAVVRRGLPLPELQARAKTAGAVLLMVTNDRPGFFASSVDAVVGQPVVIVHGDDVVELRRSLGEVVRLDVTPHARVVYDLFRQAEGGFPTPMQRVVSRSDQTRLGHQEVSYPVNRTLEASRGFGESLGDELWPVGVPQRTEYFTAGVDTAGTITFDHPENGRPAGPYSMQMWFGPTHRYGPGQHGEHYWLRAPVRPGVGSISHLPVSRTATRLAVPLSPLTDADGNNGTVLTGGGSQRPSQTTSLARDGVLIGELTSAAPEFRVPAERAAYRLTTTQQTADATVLGTRRTASWDFVSAAPDSGTAVVPLPVVDFDLATDSLGRLVGRTIDVRLVPQAAGQPPGRTRSLSVEYSTDDGTSWHRAMTRPDGRSGARVDLRGLRCDQVVSFRVTGSTVDGVSHQDTVVRAVRLG